MKPYYPLMLDLEGRNCLIIGGGKVAERKVVSLVEAKASVTLISPVITSNIDSFVVTDKIKWQNRVYQKGDLDNQFLIIIATDNQELNLEIYQHVNHRNQLVNIVDKPELCTFIVPSVINRGHLQIAISTHGASPGLAKKMRKELEATYGNEYIEYTNFLAEMREWIFKQNIDQPSRRYLFEQLLNEDYFHKIAKGLREEVENEFKSKVVYKNN